MCVVFWRAWLSYLRDHCLRLWFRPRGVVPVVVARCFVVRRAAVVPVLGTVLLAVGACMVYACTAWRLWFGSWLGRCSLCAVTGSGPVLGGWCRPALCGCSLCFGYTPGGPCSGYAGVLRYLWFGLWRCNRYVVMGFGLVPVPVGVVSLPPVSSPPPRGPVVLAVPGS